MSRPSIILIFANSEEQDVPMNCKLPVRPESLIELPVKGDRMVVPEDFAWGFVDVESIDSIDEAKNMCAVVDRCKKWFVVRRTFTLGGGVTILLRPWWQWSEANEARE